MRRSLEGVLAVGALAAVFWLGCAGNGDAPAEEPLPAGSSGSSSGSSSSSGDTSSSSSSGSTEPERPEFDASFEEEKDANVDPTPDGGDLCLDNDDPGGAENVAKQLPATDDCDNNYKTVKGVMNGPVDVDFYKFSANDKAGCSVDADFGSSTSGLELCVFVKCKGSSTTGQGCKSGTPATSGIGMKGCCTATPGKAVPTWDCSNGFDNDSADFFIRVKPASVANVCTAYSFTYRF